MDEPEKMQEADGAPALADTGSTGNGTGPHLHFGPEDDNRAEFNEYVKSLVALFFLDVANEFEQRISDLETLAQNAEGVKFSALDFPEPVPYQPVTDEVPEYRADSETDGGTPWYRG